MRFTLVNPNGHFPGPKHIDINRPLIDAFGRLETEISASWIVGFCQSRGSWTPFSKAELEAYCHANGRPEQEDFWFNGLDQRGYLVPNGAGQYQVTVEFVAACYNASPAK